MSFEQVRIKHLRAGDRVMTTDSPEDLSVVHSYTDGELNLGGHPGMVVAPQDPIPRECDDRRPVAVSVSDLRPGDLVLERIWLFEFLYPQLYEVLSYRSRTISLRLAIDPPEDGVLSVIEENGQCDVSIETDPDYAIYRDGAEPNPGVRYRCRRHLADVAPRGEPVRAFLGPFPDGLPMPRNEFLYATVAGGGSGWFPVPMLDEEGKLRRCLRCGSEIGRLLPSAADRRPSDRRGTASQRPPGLESVQRAWDRRLWGEINHLGP